MNGDASGISRVLVLGHSGFIGEALTRRIRETRPGVKVSGESYPELDLTREDHAAALTEWMEPDAAVVLLSAVKRQSGDTLDNYLANVSMTANLCRLLAERKPGRLVFFSSAAVYGEDVHDLSISEETPVRLRSYYGMAKHAGERLLEKAYQDRGGDGLVLLRPATVYGPGEPGSGYTPTGFLRKALAGQEIVLWGDGSELREFVYIDDAAALTDDLVFGDFSGTLNMVSGRSYSFRDVLGAISGLLGGLKEPETRPRSKDKADNSFDPSKLRALFPDFAFTDLSAGLAKILAAEREAAAAD